MKRVRGQILNLKNINKVKFLLFNKIIYDREKKINLKKSHYQLIYISFYIDASLIPYLCKYSQVSLLIMSSQSAN